MTQSGLGASLEADKLFTSHDGAAGAIAPATWEYDSLTMVTRAVRARPTGPANTAHCGQAFVVRPKPAIAGTAAKIVMGAPVRCSGFCDAKCDSENSEQNSWLISFQRHIDANAQAKAEQKSD
jgi:hypothetical protein